MSTIVMPLYGKELRSNKMADFAPGKVYCNHKTCWIVWLRKLISKEEVDSVVLSYRTWSRNRACSWLQFHDKYSNNPKLQYYFGTLTYHLIGPERARDYRLINYDVMPQSFICWEAWFQHMEDALCSEEWSSENSDME